MYKFDGNSFASISATKRDKIDTLLVNNKHCRAEISLFGAHLLSFVPKADNIERLWISNIAVFDKTKPIRGGIPICWPWFGSIYPTTSKTLEQKLPAHGFVRNQDWHILRIQESDEETTISFAPNTLGLFQFPELLSITIEVSFSEKCQIKLITRNGSEHSVSITAALHSYFNISDISHTQISGVQGEYIDKTQESKNRTMAGTYLIEAETDRIHLQDPNNNFNNIDIVSSNKVGIKQAGHDSVVVWNPWIEKSQTMADMETDGYRTMLCIEAAVTNGVVIAPSSQHELLQIIS